MVITEMTDEECRQALAQASVGRLGCARDNQPYVVPISFAFDGRHIFSFSTPGQKIEWMRANPLVCLEVDEGTSRDQWISVVAFGRYQELPDSPEFAAERAQAQQALHEHAKWWDYASIPGAEWRRKSGSFTPIFYRLHLDKLTGHRATPKPS